MIYDRVSELQNYADWHNVKKLINHQYQYRLRAGRYRVLFNVFEHIRVVSIEEVKPRNENTY